MPNVVLATAGYDHCIRFWEAPSGACYQTVPFQESQVNRLVITPDRKYLAAAGNPHVRLYDIGSKSTTPTMSFDGAHTSSITALGFQKDVRWMYTASEDNTIKIWDMRASGSCQRELKCGHPINSCVLHPNQAELIAGDQNGNLFVWDLSSNTRTRTEQPDGEVAIRSVSVSPNGAMCVAANNTGTCFSYKLGPEDTSIFELQQTFSAHKTYVLKTLFSPQSKLLATTSADKSVKLWNVKKDGNLSLNKTLKGHDRWVWDCVFSADSAYLVTASSDQTARLWDVSHGDTIRKYTGHIRAVVCVALQDQ
mmetsp:Transcript_4445/g.6691  ORF Transcript_4445/g.6691 Transcript_4445/m.6691 type:complete len:308 (-) Transcript_4445:142-1065(-)